MVRARMLELQAPGMKHHPRRVVTSYFFEPCIRSLAIREIACQGKTQKLEMDSDLMGTPRVQQSLHQRSPTQLGYDLVAGPCLAPRP